MENILLIQRSDKYNIKICYLLLFSIVFDCLVYLFNKESNLSLIRGGVFYLFIIYFLIKQPRIYGKSIYFVVFLLLFYWFVLMFFSSNLNRTINFYTKTIIPFLIFLTTIRSMSSLDDFVYVKKSFSYVILVSVIFALLSNIFKVGDASYTRNVDEFVRVGLGDGKLYAASISLLIFPFYLSVFNVSKREKRTIIFLSIICIIYLILSVRRTTLAVSLLGLFLFFYYSGNIKRFFKIIILFGILLLVSSPLWIELLQARMELRESKFEQEYDVTEETRYKEFDIVLTEAYNERGIKDLLFGKELFNSPGNYANGNYANRMLHVDFTRIIHGSGLLGLFFYFLIYFYIYKYYRRAKLLNINNLSYLQLRSLNGLFYSFFFVSLFISLSGQMYEITFRTMLFWVMGLIINVLGYGKKNIIYSRSIS